MHKGLATWWVSVTLFLLAGTASIQAAPDVVLELPPSVRQGEVLPVTVLSSHITGGTAELRLPNGTRHSAPVWRMAVHTRSERSAWIALLAVSSTAALGEAEVTVRFFEGEGAGHREATTQTVPVRVEDGRYRSERIALNRTMTNLRRTDDPRRAEQSRVLWELIHRMDIAARFHAGRLQLPVDDFRETSFFGDRREFQYVDGGSARSIHNGLDLAAPTGTAIRAPAAGRVVMAEDRIITGLSIVIEHLPGVYSLYYHLDSMDVSEGDLVSTGTSLGTVGSTGLSTGPHLHWELRVSGVAVDPKRYLGQPLVDTTTIVRSLSRVP